MGAGLARAASTGFAFGSVTGTVRFSSCWSNTRNDHRMPIPLFLHHRELFHLLWAQNLLGARIVLHHSSVYFVLDLEALLTQASHLVLAPDEDLSESRGLLPTQAECISIKLRTLLRVINGCCYPGYLGRC